MHDTYFKIALTLRLGSSCFNSRANNCAAYSGALTEANMKETAKSINGDYLRKLSKICKQRK